MSSAEKDENGEKNPIGVILDIDGESNQKATNKEQLEIEGKVKQVKTMLWNEYN